MPGFLTLDQVKTFVHYSKGDPGDDAILADCADAACEWVESQCGPQQPTVLTEVVTAAGDYSLRHRPSEILSVKDAATGSKIEGVSVAGWSVLSGLSTAAVVDYQTGPEQTPTWAVQAALHIARTLWMSQVRQRTTQATVQPGFLVPNIAEALVAPYRLGARP